MFVCNNDSLCWSHILKFWVVWSLYKVEKEYIFSFHSKFRWFCPFAIAVVITWIQFLWLLFSQISAFFWIGGHLQWQVTFLLLCHVDILERDTKIIISFSVLLQVFDKLRLFEAVQEKEHELDALGQIPLFLYFICYFLKKMRKQ